MRLLARMCADMDSEGAPLDEALVAARGQARVWAFIGVDSKVSLQVGFSIEVLFAQPLVCHHFQPAAGRACESAPTATDDWRLTF